jgi:rhodanese-related sulfurtransferase
MSRRIAFLAGLASLSLLGACGPAAPAADPTDAMPASTEASGALPTPAGAMTSPEAMQPDSGASADPAVAFSPEGGRFVAAAALAQALESGAYDIQVVDARPPADFEFGHIPGAINVPYFEPDKHLDKLSKDKWIVTYCECPHAEAEQVADALESAGYTQVRVIDEGLQGWRDLGLETEGGS